MAGVFNGDLGGGTAPASPAPSILPFVASSAPTGQEASPNLVITIGQLTAEDFAANINITDGVWDEYLVRSHYERDNHIYMLPIGSPGGFNGASVAFCQLASPTLLWIVDWYVAKIGNKPSLPSPETYDNGWILMDKWDNPMETTVWSDGISPLFRQAGTYVYGHQNPSKAIINYPRASWVANSAYDLTVTPNQYETQIFDGPGASSLPGVLQGIPASTAGQQGAGGSIVTPLKTGQPQ